MRRNDFEFAYRQSSVNGATTIGLVIALYDRLSRDFREAACAIRAGNIEARCSALNHATMILGHLESWIDHTSGEELAGNLVAFYSYLRSRIIEASVQQSADLLEAQISLVSQVRGAWQQKDSLASRPSVSGPLAAGMTYAAPVEHVSFSRSA